MRTVTVALKIDLRQALAEHTADGHTHEDYAMPCDSITTQTVSEALKNGMPTLIAEALKSAGWNITSQDNNSIAASRAGEKLTWAMGVGIRIVHKNGKIYSDNAVGEITRGYSKAAVSWAASRAGWTAKTTGDNTMTLSRR
jgi:hypothetical protein